MIFTSHPDLTNEVHLWLDDMVEEIHGDFDEDGTPESRTFEPTGVSMCGEEPDLHGGSLTPASETWANNVMDLLGTTGVCEECRTRVALYYDMADEVTLSCVSGYYACEECGTTAGEPALTRVFTDDEDATIVDLHVTCAECGHEWDKEELFEEVA